jgi:predicted enzyme related to lactoylglutathione lyase
MNAYTEFSANGMPGAGMMDTKVYGPNVNVPPNWMPYFHVSPTSTRRRTRPKSSVMLKVPPTDIPNVGRFSVVQDPQGAVFAIIKMAAHAPNAN